MTDFRLSVLTVGGKHDRQGPCLKAWPNTWRTKGFCNNCGAPVCQNCGGSPALSELCAVCDGDGHAKPAA